MPDERGDALAEPTPRPPDLGPVNAMWDTSLAKPRGGPLGRFVHRWLAPLFASPASFNSRQVQLDNALTTYFEERVDQTRRRYDRVLLDHEKRLAEIDERHLMLQQDLVTNVHDLVKRIDLVLARSEKDRVSLELALLEVRRTLSAIEGRLSRG